MLSRDQLMPYQLRGVRHIIEHSNAMLWEGMGLGKLQAVSEPVLTPTGWTRIGDLRPGGYVVGRDGYPTRVVGVYPQPSPRCLRVTLNDGSWTRAGPGHLWAVQSPKTRYKGGGYKTRTTQQLVDGGLYDTQGNRKWHIPMVAPVQFAPRNLLVDPYLMGVVLGDGSINDRGYISLCTDEEITQRYEGAHRSHPSDGISTLFISSLRGEMKALNLAGKRSWEKEVPEDYLFASVDQRLALLQGLLDTDGFAMKDGGVEFCSTSESLLNSVVHLAQSLGGVARKSGPRITSHQGGQGRPSWRANVKLPPQLRPFRLKRKADAWVRPTKYPPARLIAKIEEDQDEPAVCIKVEAPDQLYVTRNFIVTHNTVQVLTAVHYLFDTCQITGVLIVGPKRVVQSVWRQEILKWAHLQGLTCSVVQGTAQEREVALRRRAQLYLINYENLPWVQGKIEQLWLSRGKYPPFQMLVLDEVTKVKNATGVRSKALHAMIPYFSRRVGLTGEPAANGYKDLFGQYLAVDGGQRLGTRFEQFSQAYLKPTGYMAYSWTATPEGQQRIHARVADITLEMSAEDYLDLPPVRYNEIQVTLPPKARKIYDTLEKDFFAELDSGAELEVMQEAAKINKLLQVASGAAYLTVGGPWEEIHRAKMDALESALEEASGRPMLLGYNYVHEAERIAQTFPERPTTHSGATFLSSKLGGREFNAVLARWYRNEIPLLCGHPQSMGHGLNLTEGEAEADSIIWFSLPWSLELYNQHNARLIGGHRRKRPMAVHSMIAVDTMDEVVRDTLAGKITTQTGLKRAVRDYRRKRGM